MRQIGNTQTIIRETGASNLTSLKITMSKREQGGSARQKQTTLWRRGNWRKLGTKEQPLIGQILSLVETTRYGALDATANFLATDRGYIMYCAKDLTRHMPTPTTADLREDGEIGEVFEEETQGSVVVQISRNAGANLKRSQTHTGWAGCKRTRRSTTEGYTVAGSHLIKMRCKTQAVVALSSAEAELYG